MNMSFKNLFRNRQPLLTIHLTSGFVKWYSLRTYILTPSPYNQFHHFGSQCVMFYWPCEGPLKHICITSGGIFIHIQNMNFVLLKTVDTIDNCQRSVFSFSVSQHMHKITNLWKFELNRSLKVRDNNERKTPLSH